jgi:hypothetical protein
MMYMKMINIKWLLIYGMFVQYNNGKIYVNLSFEYYDKKCITFTKFPKKFILSNIEL